ncbi:hypothetical protein [Geopsychrobacter electrodiphilus]|uniref:hypothetical protein n=1 Tax=Geopsychrobacter electrodiphilus TaxID=225196 RepID=UPI00035E4022|nr:hypothetical protein [Geopsychrobacter electrodiphilus]
MADGAVVLDCLHCKNHGRCGEVANRCRTTLRAWVYDFILFDCPQFEPLYYRGIEGVIDHSQRQAF